MTLFTRLVVSAYLFQHETQSRVILLWEAGAVFMQAKKVRDAARIIPFATSEHPYQLLSADAATDDRTARYAFLFLHGWILRGIDYGSLAMEHSDRKLQHMPRSTRSSRV